VRAVTAEWGTKAAVIPRLSVAVFADGKMFLCDCDRRHEPRTAYNYTYTGRSFEINQIINDESSMLFVGGGLIAGRYNRDDR